MTTNYLLDGEYFPSNSFPAYYFPIPYSIPILTYNGIIFGKSYVDTSILGQSYVVSIVRDSIYFDTNIRGKTYVFKEYTPKP